MNANEMIAIWKNAKAEGWCEESEARRLIGIITYAKPKVAVEIGVFGGSSLIPQALALRETGGLIYGIDPWRQEDVLAGMLSETNIEYWSSIDLDTVYQGVKQRIDVLNLLEAVALIRDVSANAVKRFPDGSIGLLHIDGNHSEESALSDATAYLPKVTAGGFIYFDDVGWYEGGKPTTKRALDYLLENGCRVVEEEANNWAVLEVRR